MGKVSINNRILRCDSEEIEYSGELPMNLSDTVFEFLSEECETTSSSASSFDEIEDEEENDDEEKENKNENTEEDDKFWNNQHQLLQSTICRTSSLETNIRRITKDAVKEAQQSGNLCSCGRSIDNNCRKCLMELIRQRLQAAGYNSAICKSKWKSSPDIPSGEHTFLDVLDNSNPKKGEVRVIIELNFRGEFEMARANEEYNKLVKKLPEIYVGKIERLLALLKILCAAAKKCMKEKKMHLGPWRKHRYMQAKWMRTCERVSSSLPLSSGYSGRVARPRKSMLTVDLMENLSNLLPTVEVALHRPICV